MTDCERADIRDVLPDLVSGTLAPAEATRVETHVADCTDCAAEVAILRTARAIRPVAPTLDVARLVANLPRPGLARTTETPHRSVVSLDAHRRAAAVRAANAPSRWPSRSVWRAAATIGVMIVGGWSVLIVRSGGLGLIASGRGDSTQLSDTPAAVAVAPPVAAAGTPESTTTSSRASGDSRVSVSFGGLSDYSDEELQAVLDRLDKWDGATSTEATTTTPILPVKGGEGSN